MDLSVFVFGAGLTLSLVSMGGYAFCALQTEAARYQSEARSWFPTSEEIRLVQGWACARDRWLAIGGPAALVTIGAAFAAAIY